MYGRTQLISTPVTKARDKVRGFYRLVGTPDKVRGHVQWLLAQSRFMFDEVDVEVRIGICYSQSTNLFQCRSVPTINKNHLGPILSSTSLKACGSPPLPDPTQMRRRQPR